MARSKVSIAAIEAQYDKKQTQLFDEYGVFFAFSNEQFEEGKAELQAKGFKGEIASLAKYFVNGMFIFMDKAEFFFKAYANYSRERRAALKAAKSMDAYIEYELSNHECYYDGDWSRAVDAIKYIFEEATEEHIQEVFNRTRGRHEG